MGLDKELKAYEDEATGGHGVEHRWRVTSYVNASETSSGRSTTRHCSMSELASVSTHCLGATTGRKAR